MREENVQSCVMADDSRSQCVRALVLKCVKMFRLVQRRRLKSLDDLVEWRQCR
jgi:hypothetical protein